MLKNISILLLLFPFLCLSQNKEEQLLEIITSKRNNNIQQVKIDSFLQKNEKTLSKKELANCYHHLCGKWYYNKKSNLEKSIFYAKKSIILKKSLDTVFTKESLTGTLFNLGYFYYKKKNYDEAIVIFSEIVKVDCNSKTLELIAESYRVLGIINRLFGDYHKALDSFKKVLPLDISDKTKISTYRAIADNYIFLGKGYENQALVNINKADSILNTKMSSNLSYKKYIYQIKGNAYLNLKQYKKGLESYQATLKYIDSTQKRDLTVVYNNIGVSYTKLDLYDEALASFNKAIENQSYFSLIYENIGELYLTQNAFEKALYNYQKAIIYAINQSKTIDYKELPTIKELALASEEKYYILNFLNSKAIGWLKYYEHTLSKSHLQQALKTFQLADKLVDIIRSESTEYKSKLYWREKGNELYVNAVKTCYLLKDTEAASYFMEKNKALLLLEDITNEQAKENSKLPVSIAQQEFSLKSNIHLAQQQLANAKDSTKTYKGTLEDTIYTKKRLYETFVDSIAVAYPKYAAYKKKTDILSIEKIQQLLKDPHQVVLQYILGEKEGYLLYITRNDQKLFSIANISDLQENITQLLTQLQQPFYTETALSEYTSLAGKIYSTLIPEEIRQEMYGKKSVVVPDQILQMLPFEALINPKNNKYLIEESQISYAYSMSHLQALMGLNYKNDATMLAFAPVSFTDSKLPKLPLSEAEVEKITTHYPSNVFMNTSATKKTFLGNIDNQSIIHLSTHAASGTDGNPWIAFAGKKLTLHEIYATKIEADLVVLSACQTALGDLKKGEGVMSLARGFFNAGTKSVVSSLWSVNDKANEEIMASFYTFLSKGDTKATALHKAKLNYIQTHKNSSEIAPHYWAPLVLVGDVSAISSPWYLNSYLGWILVIVILLIIIYFIFKNKKYSI